VPVYSVPVATINTPSSTTASATGLTATIQDPQNTDTGDTYLWTLTGGTITAGGNTKTVTFTAGTGSSMTLNVAVTNPAGTTTNSSDAIAIYPPPVATLTAPANATSGLSVAASVPSQTGATYHWTLTPGTGVSLSGQSGLTTNSASFTPTLSAVSGSVTIAVYVTNGAGASSATTTQP
jgi:hypothetical protein